MKDGFTEKKLEGGRVCRKGLKKTECGGGGFEKKFEGGGGSERGKEEKMPGCCQKKN